MFEFFLSFDLYRRLDFIIENSFFFKYISEKVKS